ncbi:MAG: HisA/HisF-related TIM barrel protein [Ignisphaera sp.]|nr:HisA/HisF-related TIM barrel protein [Ignisphaera sp.]MCX8168270.1 HisA/HisF-related TIM barrel protein [Ignisphaera sp.]MDW8086047.1 HisA/HisF-related TIM barrel protein [Ignisphaera sp.]
MARRIRIIPVIDLMNGSVVHAIEGRREAYKPIEGSVISPSPDPRSVLQGLYMYGFREVYIADLDAIMNRGENTWVLHYAAKQGFNVMADIGRRGIEETDSESIKYVIGTEYINYPYEIERVSGRIVSFDCDDLKTRFSNIRLNASQAIELLTRISVAELIVLDLTRVGSMKGPNFQLISTVRRFYRGKIYIGGGIRGRDDIEELKRFDVDGVLIATAIHRGIILDAYI